VDVISQIGGFLQMVQVVIAFCLSMYVEKKYFDSILKQLFKVQGDLFRYDTARKISIPT